MKTKKYKTSILSDAFYLLLGSPTQSFTHSHGQLPNGTWSSSYAAYHKFQQRLRFFSVSFFLLTLLSAVTISIILQLIFPAYQIEFALAGQQIQSADTITVLNTNNSGFGSLRSALLVSDDGDTIVFKSGLSGTISLQTILPVVIKDITIDGSAASVTIDGTNVSGDRVQGISCQATITLRGLTLQNFSGNGVYGNENCAGASLTDLVVSNNGESGVLLYKSSQVTISGITAINNTEAGIGLLDASNNTVDDNLIGTLTPNDSSYGNGTYGVSIVGSLATDNTISDNLIHANTKDGIYIATNSTRQTIITNAISGNGGSGIRIIDSSSVVIGGPTAYLGNAIHDNSESGIYIFGLLTTANDHIIKNNLIGVHVDGAASGNGAHGIFVGGKVNNVTIGEVGAGNQISNNNSLGVLVDGEGQQTSGVKIVGNVFSANQGNLGGVTLAVPLRAIDLVDNGNGEIVAPTFTLCTNGRVSGTSSTTSATIHLYESDDNNQAKSYVGSVAVNNDGLWSSDSINWSFASGVTDFSGFNSFVVTVTDSNNSTSSFSAECVKTTAPESEEETTETPAIPTQETAAGESENANSAPSESNETVVPEESTETSPNTNQPATTPLKSTPTVKPKTSPTKNTNTNQNSSSSSSSSNQSTEESEQEQPQTNESSSAQQPTSNQESSTSSTVTNQENSVNANESSSSASSETSPSSSTSGTISSSTTTTSESTATAVEIPANYKTAATMAEAPQIKKRLEQANVQTQVQAEKIVEKNKEQTILPLEPNGQGENVLTVRRVIGLRPLPLALFDNKKETSNIVFSGKTEPYATVIIEIRSNPIMKITRANASGAWTLSVPADMLPEGEHSAYVETKSRGVKSAKVEIAKFVVVQEERLSVTTWIFIANLLVGTVILMVAVTLQVYQKRKQLEKKLTLLNA